MEPETSSWWSRHNLSYAKQLTDLLSPLQTFGRTYWELDELYERKIPAWKFKSTPTFAESSGAKSRSAVGGVKSEAA